MTKIIVTEINDCLECPKIFKCSATKKLTPSQRFALKTSTSIKGIHKDCPLPDKLEGL